MSKFVDEIIRDIKKNPQSWEDVKGSGLKKGGIELCCCCVGYRFLSVCFVEINDEEIPTTYWDKWKIETAVTWWYKNIDLKFLSKRVSNNTDQLRPNLFDHLSFNDVTNAIFNGGLVFICPHIEYANYRGYIFRYNTVSGEMMMLTSVGLRYIGYEKMGDSLCIDNILVPLKEIYFPIQDFCLRNNL